MGDQRCHIVSYVASTYIEVENLELIKISPFLKTGGSWLHLKSQNIPQQGSFKVKGKCLVTTLNCLLAYGYILLRNVRSCMYLTYIRILHVLLLSTNVRRHINIFSSMSNGYANECQKMKKIFSTNTFIVNAIYTAAISDTTMGLLQ